ncbi:MAG TPA: SIR2 family protein [Thermoanaerobaculia bacterium]|nr:SIR2 family protein [Thermoanaerobaculia bacterium]
MQSKLDPLISLALSIQSAPGVYIPILGSGVSRPAEIPTGWEVVIDLIRRIAAASGEDAATDPVRWFRDKFGEDPTYSDLLQALAPAPADRNAILRSYFEASDEDRDAGRKQPTKAHRALANLASKGYVRAAVTTNFDRLIESSLEAVGITPQVIASSDAISGALPVAQARFTLVKVNGDFLDLRFRNTLTELVKYDQAMEDFLHRLFEDHGLIILGWSAEWDLALRRAIEGIANRRFGAYWCARGAMSQAASDIASLRGFVTIPIADADGFLGDLQSKIESLDALNAPHPLSGRLAAAAVKRLLPKSEHEISLFDLVMSETERVATSLSEPRHRQNEPIEPWTIREQFEWFESQVSILASMFVIGGYWGAEWAERIWTKALEVLAERTFHTRLLRYPTLFLMYAGGVAAIANRKFGNVAAIVEKPNYEKDRSLYPIVLDVEINTIFEGGRETARALRDGPEKTPLSNHIFDHLRLYLEDLRLTDSSYENAFIEFEYVASLVGMREANDIRGAWDGRFLWNANIGNRVSSKIQSEIAGEYHPLFRDFIRMKPEFDEWIRHARLRLHWA